MTDVDWAVINISYILYFSAFCKPYLFIIHFSSIEIVKLDSEAYSTPERDPERTLIELSSPRYLGTAGSKGIYVMTMTSYLDLLKINGSSNMSLLSGSSTSLDTLYVAFFSLRLIYWHK